MEYDPYALTYEWKLICQNPKCRHEMGGGTFANGVSPSMDWPLLCKKCRADVCWTPPWIPTATFVPYSILDAIGDLDKQSPEEGARRVIEGDP